MSEPMLNAEVSGSSPKLQQVRYVNVLPQGKQGDYTQNNRVDFMPDPVTAPYFDGAQSYLNIRVRNTSNFEQGNSASAPTANPPICFPAHVGVNALINRCVERSKDGVVIEDIEAYNQITGIAQSYSHDSDVFPTLSRISGVAGRTCEPMNQTIDNLGVNYFLPNGALNASSNTITGGNEGVSASFCVPVQTGLMSAFGFQKDSFGNLSRQHHVVPNLDVGGLHLQFFLEKNNVALQTMYSKFYKETTINGTAVVEEYAKYPLESHSAVKTGTQILLDTSVCDTSKVVNDVPYDPSMCVFRVGAILSDGTDQRVITSVKTDQGASSNQIEIEVDVAFSAGDGAVNVQLGAINRNYVIDKIELKLLLTIPDDQTLRMIRSQMARGISFTSMQLYKQSTAQQLKNAVIDIPEALTRAQAILAVPCQQDDLEAVDIFNSYIYTRPDALLPIGGNTNNYTYQWQIENLLLPNLAVDTNSKTNNQNDNSIFFNQQVMALRHLIEVKALADAPKVRKSEDVDLELPYFLPVSLSPRGVSYDLVNSAPQLRITNSASGADIKAKLFHIHCVHTRILTATDGGVEVAF